jgi:predicted RNA polymerase sigma factor
MAQRISRAKRTIKDSGIPFRTPDECERVQRLATVLHTLYLIFNEGHTSSIGPNLYRSDLSREAIRLARIVHDLLPDDSEVTGLLALMVLTDARRPARTGRGGELIPLAEQDRTLWDQRQIGEGIDLITGALPKGPIGPYQIQAAIAAVHDEAKRAEETDWRQILVLYGLLRRFSDNPMVTLNHAIATAMVHGPGAGLEMLSTLDTDEQFSRHYRLAAVRAHLHELAGDFAAAVESYLQAANRTTSTPERDYLNLRAARLVGKTATRVRPGADTKSC